MKKVIASVLSLAMIAALATGCTSTSTNESGSTTATAGNSAESGASAATEGADTGSGDKEVINLWAFTDEVPNMVAKYIELHPEFGEKYDVKTTVIATTDGAYQPALDQALAAGGEDAPDIYCAESAFVLKYTQGDASGYAATYKDLGIDVDAEIDAAKIAQYSVDIGTRDGDVVALGYQATGGAMIYRRSIAKDAFGTDDPDEIANLVSGPGWDNFFTAAETLKGKGYAIVSGDGDIWHSVENSSSSGWIVDGALNIPTEREDFLDLSMKLTENGYSNQTQDWSEGWFADMRDEGEKPVFCFFGPAWLINYTIGSNCGDTAGDWAVCKPPVGFFWGGTWLLANKDTEQKEGVAELINWITLDCTKDGLQYMWANGLMSEDGTKDAVASGTVMEMSDGTLDFLGGQNMFDVFIPANDYANGSNLTQYDETINKAWRDAVTQYTSGELSRDDAIQAFKDTVAGTLDVTVD